MTTERIADHVKFAYWVPNVSGGLVTSDIEQRTDWNYDYNKKLAQTAENNGFEYALSQVRYEASYGAEYQHESTSFSLALLLATERLKVIAAVHPGLWQPAVLAKLGATADHLSGGRFAVNVVSGWFKDEFTHLGEPWLEHDERYRRSAEFLQVLRRIWTEDGVDFRGDFYRIHDFTLKPKPVNTPERPNPEIFQGGNSTAARRNGGLYSDWYFSNGKDFDGLTEQVVEVRDHARTVDREVRVGLNGFIIARDTEREAREVLREIIEKANSPAVEGFRGAVAAGGQLHRRQEGHVGGLLVRGPGAVQRRIPHATDRHARADRRTDRRIPQTRRRSDPRRLPSLPGGDRVLRCQRAAVGARNRGVRREFARRPGSGPRLTPGCLLAAPGRVPTRPRAPDPCGRALAWMVESSTGEVMTYPPGSPGYSSTPPTTQFSAPTQQLSKLPEPAAEGSSKLSLYLGAAVAVFGLAVYLSSFGPQFTISNSEFPQLGSASGSTLGLGIAVVAAVISALLAGVSLLPRQKNFGAVVAVTAVLAFLLVIAEVINAPSGAKIDWALYLIIAFTLLEAIAAVAWLLLDAGIVSAPAPRPKYEQPQQQYSQYGGPGGYYGQQPQHGGPGQQQQRPGYPQQQYGQGGGYPGGGPHTGGFPAVNPQSGPPTPPTGFPAYGNPQSSGGPGNSGSQAPTQQTAQPQPPATQQSSPPPS